MSGYIKLHRGWHDSAVFKSAGTYCERAAWAWLLSNAAWKDTARRTGQGGVVDLRRGEIHVSLASLASAWGWSIKRVRGFIERLEKGHMVGTKKGKAGTVITILNYDKYQGDDSSRGTPLGTKKGTARAQLGHTQEEGKEGEEEKKEEADPPNGGSGYAFSGSVIRLRKADLDNWRAAYHAIPDIMAELASLDAWFQGDGAGKAAKWFFTAAGALNRKHQEIMAQRNQAEADYFKVPL